MSGWSRRLWPEWLGRDLSIILAARALMSSARAIAGVVTALYLAAEGFSGLKLGLLFLCVALAGALMSAGVGIVSDAMGRKPFLAGLPLLAAASAVVFATSRSVALLFVFAALGSFGRGAGAGAGSVGPYKPAEAALLAEKVPARVRTDAFGRLAFLSSLGALVGGLRAALARPAHATGAAAMAAYRPAFLAAAGLAALAGLLALGLQEPPRRGPPGRPKLIFPRRSRGVLWRLLITNSLSGMAVGMFGPFLSYWFHRRFGASPGQIGVLFAFVNLASLASTLSAAAVGSKLGALPAIVAVRAVEGVLLIPMALAASFWVAGAVYLVRMVVQRLGQPLRESFAQGVADPAERASLVALSNVPSQGIQAGSQVLAGYLFQEVALAAPLILAGAVQMANAAVYQILFRQSVSEYPLRDGSGPGAPEEALA